jgi:hypothetical protein
VTTFRESKPPRNETTSREYLPPRKILKRKLELGHNLIILSLILNESYIHVCILLNIGSLTEKLMEIVNTMIRRRINMVCLQETKWVGEKSREIEHIEYKVWYTRGDKNRNEVEG